MMVRISADLLTHEFQINIPISLPPAISTGTKNGFDGNFCLCSASMLEIFIWV